MNLALLNIGRPSLNSDWNWKGVYSPFARLYHVLSGCARVRIGEKTHTLTPGHLYLVPPFTLHDDECNSPFSLCYVHFWEEAVAGESVFDKFDFPAEVAACDADDALFLRLQEINPGRGLPHFDPGRYDNLTHFKQYAADNSRLPLHSVVESRGILCQLLSRFLAEATPKRHAGDRRIGKSIAVIHANVGRELSVGSLADGACMTTDHFIRLFRRETGRTPLEYIHIKKMEKAQLMLLSTPMPIKEIALDLGIDNVSYFNRLFRRHTGRTPGEYRLSYVR